MSQPQKKKIDRALFTIEKKDGETVYKHMNEVGEHNLDFKCRNNKDSTIYIFDFFSSMSIDKCENCKIITGPVETSIFIRNCKNCSISTIAKQIRLRDCENINIFTYCTTDPAVENSFNILFAPYNAFFPHLKELFTNANFKSEEENKYVTPYDFTVDKILGEGAKHFGFLEKKDFRVEEVRDGEDPIEEIYSGYINSNEFGQFKPDDFNLVFENKEIDMGNKGGDDFIFDNDNNNNLGNNMNQMNQMNNNAFDFVSNVPLGKEGFEGSNNDQMNMNMFFNNTNNYNEGNNLSNNQMDFMTSNNNNNFSSKIEEDDEQEIERQNLRRQEAEKRAQKIREIQEREIQLKNENREKALAYIENFNKARYAKIEENKKNNNYNEQKLIEEKAELKQMLNEGKNINSWKTVSDNIDLKESDYKGTKDVSRMREAIIKRKNDNC